MSDFDPYFTDPCELVTIVYGSDGITELGRYSLRGYAKNMNRFFQICTLIAYEAAHSNPEGKNSDFEVYLRTIRDFYHAYVKSGEMKHIEDSIQQSIDDLKQYKFKSRRIFLFLPESDASSLDRREFEITIDRIFKWIIKMLQYRIYFYERVLQEYKAREDQYNQRLLEYLENDKKRSINNLSELNIDSIFSELGLKSENHSNGGLFKPLFQISNQSWYLEDLLKLDNPEIERYTKKLPRYRSGGLHVDPDELKAFFELFVIFRNEMKFILPDETDKNFFERVLTVLKRDFLDRFEEQGDLEETIIEYIDGLEKYIFLSLPKEQFFNKLSRMIYGLRARRIEYYEAVLADYLANKEKYDAVL